MGGGLLQKVNRDTMSMAVKLSAITYEDGTERHLMKFPKEGSEKVSLPGRFAVYADAAQGGAPVTHRSTEEKEGEADLLRLVYDGGRALDTSGVWDDFDTVRTRVADQWRRFPLKARAVSEALLEHQRHVHQQQELSVAGGDAFHQ
ncbi:hypothetical protein GGI21_004134 [Coemansia aciculifera]|nr:hypothetical protein GGI21_004134 [Coemansia aciculifera]